MKKILIPIFLWSNFSFGQTGLWMDVSMSKKWNKTQSSGFGIGNRQNLGLGFDRLFLDAAHQVRVIDGLQIEATYRLVLNEKADQLVLVGNRLSQRFQLGFKLSILDALDLGPKRLNLNWTSTQQWGLQIGKQTSSVWRNKISLGYDIKDFPLSPMISAEHFYQWNASIVYTPTEVLVSGATVQWRYFAGVEIELPKKQSVKIQAGLRQRASGNQALLRLSYNKSF
ncbi:MAG: hypothetical protein RL207_682 [Bacteroidota bacterium]|jgi:hypothetical protein